MKCDYCRHVQDESKGVFCDRCGRKVSKVMIHPEAEKVAAKPGWGEEEESQRCHNCGDSTTKPICPNCGEPMRKRNF